MQAGGDIALALHHAHAAQPPLLELVKDAMSAAPEVPEPDDEGPLYGGPAAHGCSTSPMLRRW